MSRGPLSKRQQWADRIIAAAIYVFSGLIAGVGGDILLGQVWTFTVIGLLTGILVAVLMDRRERASRPVDEPGAP